MPELLVEFFQEVFRRDAALHWGPVTFQFFAAFLLGCLVAAIYHFTHGRAGQSTGMMATLVLLTMLIAAVTLVIGDNTARAFSLVGALAIIRFRTIVEDTRDTAFVIFAVAIGMAVGAGFLLLPVLVIPFVAVAAFLFRPRTAPAPTGSFEYTLNVRLGVGHDPQQQLRGPFERHVERTYLLAVTTARQGASVDLYYGVRLRRDESATALVTELNGTEGVQSVELRRA